VDFRPRPGPTQLLGLGDEHVEVRLVNPVEPFREPLELPVLVGDPS